MLPQYQSNSYVKANRMAVNNNKHKKISWQSEEIASKSVSFLAPLTLEIVILSYSLDGIKLLLFLFGPWGDWNPMRREQ